MTDKKIPEWYHRFFKTIETQRKAIESSLEKARIAGVSTQKRPLSASEFVKVTQEIAGAVVNSISNFTSAVSHMSTTDCEGTEDHIVDARLKLIEDSGKEMLRSHDRVASTLVEEDARTLKNAFSKMVTAPMIQICEFAKTLPDPSRTDDFPSEVHMRIEFDFDDEAAAVTEELNGLTQRLASSQAFSDGACFVATAIYGDSRTWQVDVLRRFCDEQLMRTAIGRLVIKIYRRTGPRWLQQSHDTRCLEVRFIVFLTSSQFGL